MARRLWCPPDGEGILIDYLHENRDVFDCGVSLIKPKETPWVQVRGTGGGVHTAVSDWCQITITCWAGKDDWDTARKTADLVRALIDDAVEKGSMGEVECYGIIWLVTAYNDPDPETGVARVTQTARIALRGSYV